MFRLGLSVSESVEALQPGPRSWAGWSSHAYSRGVRAGPPQGMWRQRVSEKLRGPGLWVGRLRRFGRSGVHLSGVLLEGGSSLVGIPSVSSAGGAAPDGAVTLAVTERGAGLPLCGCHLVIHLLSLHHGLRDLL